MHARRAAASTSVLTPMRAHIVASPDGRLGNEAEALAAMRTLLAAPLLVLGLVVLGLPISGAFALEYGLFAVAALMMGSKPDVPAERTQCRHHLAVSAAQQRPNRERRGKHRGRLARRHRHVLVERHVAAALERHVEVLPFHQAQARLVQFAHRLDHPTLLCARLG